ncbi:MAG: type II toxin-antitoxin system RelE/ParE family toxin [Coriobacteriia bacterium]|nr:type II toxin-antitoxin system RelE/ParE family toxin [Coriobacteriia bacterium]MBS5477424.1 type II toxin-antitoxin system RelE/ParE family toxin [Coriobacteriia bacterium]
MTTLQFDRWLRRLKDPLGQAAIIFCITRVRKHGIEAVDWKPVQENVLELRIKTGPGYRVYALRKGPALLLLLAGGDKSTQQRDITRACKLARSQEKGRENGQTPENDPVGSGALPNKRGNHRRLPQPRHGRRR